MTPEEKIEKAKIDLLRFDYENLHTSMWENHRTSWVVSGIIIPVIFTLEGLFINGYFEKEDFTISWQYIFSFYYRGYPYTVFGSYMVACHECIS